MNDNNSRQESVIETSKIESSGSTSEKGPTIGAEQKDIWKITAEILQELEKQKDNIKKQNDLVIFGFIILAVMVAAMLMDLMMFKYDAYQNSINDIRDMNIKLDSLSHGSTNINTSAPSKAGGKTPAIITSPFQLLPVTPNQ